MALSILESTRTALSPQARLATLCCDNAPNMVSAAPQVLRNVFPDLQVAGCDIHALQLGAASLPPLTHPPTKPHLFAPRKPDFFLFFQLKNSYFSCRLRWWMCSGVRRTRDECAIMHAGVFAVVHFRFLS